MTPNFILSTPSELVTGLVLEDLTELTLVDLCRACAAKADMIIELVDEGVLIPVGDAPEYWRFTGLHMQRAKVAVRLQRDLGVNLAGAALALQLMDDMQALKEQLDGMQQLEQARRVKRM